MFNWALFFILITVCLPGVLIAVPGLLRTLEPALARAATQGKTQPPRAVLVALTSAQTLLIVAGAAALGVALAPRVGLAAPLVGAFLSNTSAWAVVAPTLPAVLALGLGGSLLVIALYYLVVRPRLDAVTLEVSERLRTETGIWGRILYGGVVEEVISRWGLMTLLAYLGARLVGSPTPVVMWAAILLAGLLFGALHLPTYLIAGCKPTPWFVGGTLGLNLLASVLFGLLFWHYGLYAAVTAHALFHLAWWPLERLEARRTGAALRTQ